LTAPAPAFSGKASPRPTLKEITQRQIIMIVDTRALPQIYRPHLGSLGAQKHIGRQAKISIGSEEQVLTYGSGIQVPVAVVHLAGEQVQVQPFGRPDGDLSPAAPAAHDFQVTADDREPLSGSTAQMRHVSPAVKCAGELYTSPGI